MNKKRAIVIIIDGVGVGEMPDASNYGDQGSHTLANMAAVVGGLHLPNLEKMGLGKIAPIQGLNGSLKALANYGKMAEKSKGKDSTTGHWELAGLIVNHPFPTYPEGFPKEVISQFERKIGRETLGNKPASGTEIIKELGEEHIKTGKPIVYTSADSVFQIAAHEEVIPLNELYDMCEIARKMLTGKHAVARVIARPFIGNTASDFSRTKYRKDFSLKPFGKIMHQIFQDNEIATVAIGKINDLYAFTGITKSTHTKTNTEGMSALLEELDETESGFIMANLVDFDMLWGHRNDPTGFYEGLKAFDQWLPLFIEKLNENDLLIITADHGNDPTTISTDHSREYVPVLAYGPGLKSDQNIGTRDTFADLQATLAEYFTVPSTGAGKSFLNLLN
ncbi:MAG: phosphopentomutase [Calditrichaceae bacterium]|nr:phosphopentomutase [Calditrichaceae bacterium]HES59444.1 phosphopentomutase [Caldithrix sp.]